VLARLRLQRAKDRQAFAFRQGDYWITPPMPDASTEVVMLDMPEDDEAEME
jgi:hypothetical protein